jgi:predicted ATPase/DNA-binding CsgD family transcriptional regulator
MEGTSRARSCLVAILCMDAPAATAARRDRALDRARARAVARGGKPTGADGAAFEFRLSSDAIAAAVACATDPEGHDTDLRAAIVVGESGPTGNDAAVDRARRLLAAAHPGQVVASIATVESGQHGLDQEIGVRPLGTVSLPGEARPLAVAQIDRAGSARTFPTLRHAHTPTAPLPRPTTSFVGRRADIEVLGALVQAHALVTVVGAGGCGKTRLAVEVARAWPAADGAVWLDLAAVTAADSVLDAAATAVGLSGSALPTPARIAGQLGARAALVVVDNCEHVLDAAAELIAALNAECPGVRVLATSREPLALSGEAVWRVPSLSVPAGDSPEALLDSDAGRLLVDRIRLVRPGFVPDHGEAAALARVCRRLDGIPLALELVAARAALLPPVEIADRLTERFSAFGTGTRDVAARQRTLEGSVAWSYQLLDDDDRAAFRRLGAFTGSFPLAAAADLVGGEDTVLRLARGSLLVDRTDGREPRFAMLEAVRWYARDRLVEHGEATDAFARHLAWCTTVAESLGPELEGPRAVAALRALDAELDNLRAAMGWAIDHARAGDAAGIIAATPWFWIWRGRIPEARRWLGRAGVPPIDEPGPRLAVLWARLELEVNTASGDDDVTGHTREALELARAIADERTEAKLLVSLSRHDAFREPQAVIDTAQSHRERCRRVGEDFWTGISLVSESLAHITLGRFDRAEGVLDQLRVVAAEVGHPQLVADEIARRAIVDRRLGRYDAVARAVPTVEAVTEGFTDLNSRALVHAQAALVDVARGHAPAALEHVDAMFERYRAAGELSYLASFLLPIMEALVDLGRPAEALRRSDELWPVCREILSWRLRLGTPRATAMLALGDLDSARAALADVVEVAAAAPNDHEEAIAQRLIAGIDRIEQRYGAAEDRLHRALAVQADLGYPQYVADVLEDLAGIELEHDRAEAAATLFGAADTIRASAGVVRRVGGQARYDADVAELAARLDPAVLDERRSRGATLSLADAVDYAQRGRGQRGRPTRGWESLTATELKVADLAAQGLANPEIAERLIMGRATVKTHVSSILRKLDLTNRTQLARVAAPGRPAARTDRR